MVFETEEEPLVVSLGVEVIVEDEVVLGFVDPVRVE